MSAEVELGDRLDVIRAAIAATVADKIDAPLAVNDGQPLGDGSFLVMCGGLGGLGRQLIEELLPLELLMRSATGGGDEPAGSITTTDTFLDSLMAQLHDTILNPAVPFQLDPPPLVDVRTINEVYGESVGSADVAGDVELSPEAVAANELLFDDGEPSEILAAYERFKEDVTVADAALRDLPASASSAERERLETTLAGLEAQWIGIGHKREVEAAFRTIVDAQSDAGFEDERRAIVERFEAGRRPRIDAPGLSYHSARLVPTAPLFEEHATNWDEVDLDRDEVIAACGSATRRAFGLDAATIERGCTGLRELRFQFLVCDIVRDWLDRRWFDARYWRAEDEPPLSDGAGGGSLPCLPHRIVFIRNAVFSTDDVGVELVSPRPRSGEVVIPRILPKRLALDTMIAEPRPELLVAAQRAGLESAAKVIKTEQVALNRAVLSPAMMRAASIATPMTATLATGAAAGRSADTSNPPAGGATRPTGRLGGIAARLRSSSLAHRFDRVISATRPTNRPSSTSAVNVSGKITTTGDLPDLGDALAVSVMPTDPTLDATGVALERKNAKTYTFSTTLRRRHTDGPTRVKTYAVRLHRRDGEVIAEFSVDMATHAGKKVELQWRAIPQPTVIAIAEDVPIAHAYAVRVVPACPDPDDTLVWT